MAGRAPPHQDGRVLRAGRGDGGVAANAVSRAHSVFIASAEDRELENRWAFLRSFLGSFVTRGRRAKPPEEAQPEA